VAIGDATDMLDLHGDVYADLGEVFLLSGEARRAITALEQAVER
jgi:hypothetical protein